MKALIGDVNQIENLDEIKEILYKKLKYKENEETYKLFKNMYIRKSLIKKDYNDLKRVFSKFVPDSVFGEISEKGTEKIGLGISIKKELNILFLDIVGFTSITEVIKPERALLLLNIYFDGIVEIVKSNGGYIDKFLGDGIMVIFDMENTDSIIKASIEIQIFMQKFNVSEVGKKIGVGIGINSGDVILGIVGSKDRMEATIIGDTVNIASRLEGLTRLYNTNIIISEATYNRIQDKTKFSIEDLGYKELKGKEKKIRIYSVNNYINISLEENKK